MKSDQNELITHVGPGTPCGAMLRRYWQPHRFHRPVQHGGIERGVEFIDQRDRLPIAPKQGAARRARADPGDQFVLLAFHEVGVLANLKRV